MNQLTDESIKHLLILFLVLAALAASKVRRKEAVKPVWYSQLTTKEKYLFYWLAIIEGEGQMALLIQRVCKGDSVADFRQLVKELKDQWRDAPVETIKLLGEPAAKILQTIS